MKIGKALTWNQLAEQYDKTHPGRPAMTYPVEAIFRWAESHPETFFYNEKEDTIHLKQMED
jgi:hypothetical protein